MPRCRRAAPVVAALAVAVTITPGAQEPAAWLSLCADPPAGGLSQTRYETTDGRELTAAVTSSAVDGCAGLRIPAHVDEIVWARFVPAKVASRLTKGLLLQGGAEAPELNSEIIPLIDEPQPPAPELTANAGAAAGAGPAIPPRAMWVWRREGWQAESANTLALAASWNVRAIYVAVAIDADGAVADADRLRAFLRDAGDRGISVWAVDGDPRAVTDAGRAALERRTRALAAFNTAGPQRLAGLQLDIEPYLVPGYSLDEDAWNAAYVRTVQQAGAAAGMPVEVAVPFWWLDSRTNGELVMDRVAGAIASVAIMAYRTDPEIIEKLALRWLAWGSARERRVRVALEAGRLPDEVRYRFAPAASGQLWQLRSGDLHALVLLRTARPNPAGPAFMSRASARSDASTITFFGRTDALRAMLPALERRLAVSPAFAGMALHELPPLAAGR